MKIRVLVAKPGLDGHDRGAKVVARALRDAGFEVIYTGIKLTPEQIAEAALQDDVKVVALSLLSGAHNTLFPKVVELMRAKGLNDVLVIGGGVIGLETASYFAAVGSDVTVVEMLPKIAGPTDADISRILQRNLEKAGIKFLLSAKVTSVSGKKNGGSTKK